MNPSCTTQCSGAPFVRDSSLENGGYGLDMATCLIHDIDIRVAAMIVTQLRPPALSLFSAICCLMVANLATFIVITGAVVTCAVNSLRTI